MVTKLLKLARFIWHIPRKVLGVLIKGYQRTFSLDHGPMKKHLPYGYCKFSPTCSEYGYRVIMKYGVIRGGIKAIWRVMKCNPCGKGGYDPVE